MYMYFVETKTILHNPYRPFGRHCEATTHRLVTFRVPLLHLKSRQVKLIGEDITVLVCAWMISQIQKKRIV